VSETLLRIETRATAERLRLLRSVVREAGEMEGFNGDDLLDLVLAVDEACQNIVRHAYADHALERPLTLEIRRDDVALTFILRDAGRPVDLAAIETAPPDALRPGGRGLHLIRSVMDVVEQHPVADDHGNELHLGKHLKQISP